MIPNLTGVPETMLWTLHNRASEAARPNPILRDPKAQEIYRALDYHFVRSFGKPHSVHGVRSLVFDQAIEEFLEKHPGAAVVNLGEGLETQRYRIRGEVGIWYTVDLPEAIAAREAFIAPDARHVHLPVSAHDASWMDRVRRESPGPVFIAAQGLLMYFEPHLVKALFQRIARELPDSHLMFDAIPPWFSRKSLRGWQRTPYYLVPPMPWSTTYASLPKTLKAWGLEGTQIHWWHYWFPRGWLRYAFGLVRRLPILRNQMFFMVELSWQAPAQPAAKRPS